MERDKILYYKEGYKYQTTRDYHIKLIDIVDKDGKVIFERPKISSHVDTGYITLDVEGNMVFRKSYAYNGASGPTIDTKDSMIGSLVHDGGYQLIRQGFVDSKYKEYFDQLLHDCCTGDGMFSWRADYWKWAVLNFGTGSTRPSAEPLELMAP